MNPSVKSVNPTRIFVKIAMLKGMYDVSLIKNVENSTNTPKNNQKIPIIFNGSNSFIFDSVLSILYLDQYF
jgi:hypothetical protein